MLDPKGQFGSEEYQLDRKATALKRAGDWDGAIAALRRRKEIMGLEWVDDKLAKYLQQAGRFDEAMAEIQWLLDHTHAQAQASLSQRPASMLLWHRTQRRGQFHASAALICKRAKRPDLQAEHERQRDACMRLVEKIEPVARADDKALRQAWEAARASGPQAMQELSEARNAQIARNQALADGTTKETAA